MPIIEAITAPLPTPRPAGWLCGHGGGLVILATPIENASAPTNWIAPEHGFEAADLLLRF